MKPIHSLQLMTAVVFAGGCMACGAIEMPLILALSGSDSYVELTIPADSNNPPIRIDLEGGLQTTLTTEIGLEELLFRLPLHAVIELDDLVFAGTPFELVGMYTDEVCATPDWGAPQGGTAVIDQIRNEAHFAMQTSTRVIVGNVILTQLMPAGIPLAVSVDQTSRLDLFDLIALLLGNSDGVITITQPVSEVVVVTLFAPLPVGVQGQLVLTTASEFPTSASIDDCIALLEERPWPL